MTRIDRLYVHRDDCFTSQPSNLEAVRLISIDEDAADQRHQSFIRENIARSKAHEQQESQQESL